MMVLAVKNDCIHHMDTYIPPEYHFLFKAAILLLCKNWVGVQNGSS